MLETVTRVAAPLIPLVGEEIWQGLTGGRSVHLEDWPLAALFPDEPVARRRHGPGAGGRLGGARAAQGQGAARAAAARPAHRGHAQIRGRSPSSARSSATSSTSRRSTSVEFDEGSLEAYGITRQLTVNARAAGPRIGKQVQAVIQAAKAGDWSAATATPSWSAASNCVAGEFDLELRAADESTAIAFLPGGGFVLLDTVTTPELEAEGLARDVIRAIQDTRKAAGLQVSDRITLADSWRVRDRCQRAPVVQ